ncbi:hypothetical protein VOLCADRAFT_106695 [Volvox carteri f. nagariensis]|uniref:Peptidase M11 gametolysin domain-containing protein n=1 Tax=Volvox carteri f. nagariensis TaxID=3068 RepID=D8U953_VOLCA|nr:uncharacterized protein VOLCADRAFT_106695 [Volvox carteri f. nagariensis]EFJ43691.1 hypothetical protein VOLCADRAFT_106695 [Volvox carteri f. nagariensis]|eukprot:XP_002955172.1 hypothetical protein VOLCADRAFT_106695 [Volvox carteri f. nagariensis]
MRTSAIFTLRASVLILTCISHLGLISQATFDESSGTAKGSLLMLMSSIHGGQDASKYYLRQDDGQMYSLSFCSELGSLGLASNLRVQVNYNRIEDGVMYSCQIPVPLDDDSPSSTPVSASKRRELFGPTISTPKRPTFLIYIVTLCGFSQPAVATASRMRDFFFRNNSISLSGYYDTCSYGQISVLPEQVEIVTGLEIPCNGTLDLPFRFPTGNKFDTRNCENDNLVKWQYYLDDVVSDMGITPTDFHHKVIYLPPTFVGYRCNNFAGTASVGPWIKTDSKINDYGTGLIWMAGDVFPNIEYFFHEVGHTLSMAHATIPNGCDLRDQCDHTCPMGATGGQGIRCLNAPHMWQLGWSQPMRRLTESDLPYGASREILIPRQMSTKDSYVVVSGVRGLVPTDAMYFAVRMNEYPYELPFEVNNNKPYIVVHSYNGTSMAPYVQTVLLGEISVNNRFVHNSSNVVVKFTGWDAVRGATARFCRRSSTREQTCGDGLDDDCDFLPDELDPDCPATTAGTQPATAASPKSAATASPKSAATASPKPAASASPKSAASASPKSAASASPKPGKAATGPAATASAITNKSPASPTSTAAASTQPATVTTTSPQSYSATVATVRQNANFRDNLQAAVSTSIFSVAYWAALAKHAIGGGDFQTERLLVIGVGGSSSLRPKYV